MEDQEETEIVMDIGRMARVILGSGMQAAEQMQRQAHMATQERESQAARERTMVEQIGRDFSSNPFWKNASSESIADRMTVVAELADRHPEAARTYMEGADRIRNQFGINVEDINRDHPTAPADRHAALRDAMDDYFASHRLDTEEEKTPEVEKDQEAERDPEAEPDNEAEPETGLDAPSADEARKDESAALSRAADAGAEEAQDKKNAEGQEGKEASVSEEKPAPWQPGEATPGAAQALNSWREHNGGKVSQDFPKEPSVTNSDVAMKNRKRVVSSAEPNRTQEKVQSR